jgi:hypothetical protein
METEGRIHFETPKDAMRSKHVILLTPLKYILLEEIQQQYNTNHYPMER